MASIYYKLADRSGRELACILSIAGNASSNPANRLNVRLLLIIYVWKSRNLRPADLSSRGLFQVCVTRCDNNPLYVQWVRRRG